MSDIEPRGSNGGIELDYELESELMADTPTRLKALGDPLRLAVVDLVLERAMTVTEIAERVGRPRGSVAHHVDVLVDAGLIRVVRTRKVRAIDERYYGRTARTFVMHHNADEMPFVREANEQVLFDRGDLPAGSTFRHARIPADRVQDYLDRLHALALEFSSEARDGDTEYGLMFHVFPTNRYQPTPDSGDAPS